MRFRWMSSKEERTSVDIIFDKISNTTKRKVNSMLMISKNQLFLTSAYNKTCRKIYSFSHLYLSQSPLTIFLPKRLLNLKKVKYGLPTTISLIHQPPTKMRPGHFYVCENCTKVKKKCVFSICYFFFV
jgi:hypothetical protein